MLDKRWGNASHAQLSEKRVACKQKNFRRPKICRYAHCAAGSKQRQGRRSDERPLCEVSGTRIQDRDVQAAYNEDLKGAGAVGV